MALPVNVRKFHPGGVPWACKQRFHPNSIGKASKWMKVTLFAITADWVKQWKSSQTLVLPIKPSMLYY